MILKITVFFYTHLHTGSFVNYLPMDHIQYKKTTLNNQLIFKLSTIGFALHSKLCYTNRIDVGIHDYIEYVAQLKHGDKIFISRTESNISFRMMISILQARNVKLIFYLLEEPVIPFEYVSQLLPVAIRIFVQNNMYDIPNVHILPIGIRDCGTIVAMHSRFNQKYLLEYGNNVLESKRNIMCLLCFSIWTHPTRQECYDLFVASASASASFVYNLNDDPDLQEIAAQRNTAEFFYERIPEIVVYKKTRESRYALCPRGCGVDTHRFYECIYLGCIPIVLRTNSVFDRLYTAFPCLVADNWSDVTEELLERSYPEGWQRMREFHAKYPRFLTDLDSIDGLLMEL